MDFRRIKASSNTITRDTAALSDRAGSIYEAIAIVGKRANQISVELKDDLSKKLQEFSSCADNMEEVFENREQIEISRFYEKIPKPVLIAMHEFEAGEIYSRNPAREKANARETSE
ncbi:MAG: DNA-directed RNA polymerase subunit omega [Odoribacteraceae bacterium]|nr:DNA-directed RNA polymerase subunit omega [Odoribacteraceae bacterium]